MIWLVCTFQMGILLLLFNVLSSNSHFVYLTSDQYGILYIIDDLVIVFSVYLDGDYEAQ